MRVALWATVIDAPWYIGLSPASLSCIKFASSCSRESIASYQMQLSSDSCQLSLCFHQVSAVSWLLKKRKKKKTWYKRDLLIIYQYQRSKNMWTNWIFPFWIIPFQQKNLINLYQIHYAPRSSETRYHWPLTISLIWNLRVLPFESMGWKNIQTWHVSDRVENIVSKGEITRNSSFSYNALTGKNFRSIKKTIYYKCKGKTRPTLVILILWLQN